MIYSENLTVEKAYEEIYLSFKELDTKFQINDLASFEFQESLVDWVERNSLKTKDIDLILSISELKVFQIEIPKLKQIERKKLISNILDTNDLYNKDKDNLNIICYSYEKSEKLIFVIVEREKIEKEKENLKQIGYDLRNVDADFNMIPYCVPQGLGIERYMYIGYGEEYVGIVVYEGAEIVYLENIKLRNKVSNDASKIKNATLVANLYLNKFLSDKDYELDLIVVRSPMIKNEILDFFDIKVMSIEELKWI